MARIAVDMDGTILRLPADWEPVRRALVISMGPRGADILWALSAAWGTPMYRRIHELMEGAELEAARRAEPFPDSLPFLTRASLGNELYLVTLQGREAADIALESAGLSGFFRGIVTREEAPDRVSQLRLLGPPPGDLWLVDDNVRNAAAVEGAGAAAGVVWICRSGDRSWCLRRASDMGLRAPAASDLREAAALLPGP